MMRHSRVVSVAGFLGGRSDRRGKNFFTVNGIKRITPVAEVLVRYDADIRPAGGSGDVITPLNMTNSPTFSGVSNPTI